MKDLGRYPKRRGIGIRSPFPQIYDRVAEGKKPTCVHHCLAQVLKFGPVDELVADLDRKPKQALFVPR